WQNAGEHVLVADSDGVAFLASDPGYKFRGLGLLWPQTRATRGKADRYLGAPVADIEGTILERRGADVVVQISAPDRGVAYLGQAASLPDYGWTIYRLSGLASVYEDRRDGTIIGGSLSALIIILALYVVQRHRAYVAAKR